MEIEMKGAQGIEVTADGRRVSPVEIRDRGLRAVGRKILAERQEDIQNGREHRALNAAEERALTLATAGAIAGQPQPQAPAPESAKDEPAPEAPPAPDPDGEARTQMLRQQVALEETAHRPK